MRKKQKKNIRREDLKSGNRKLKAPCLGLNPWPPTCLLWSVGCFFFNFYYFILKDGDHMTCSQAISCYSVICFTIWSFSAEKSVSLSPSFTLWLPPCINIISFKHITNETDVPHAFTPSRLQCLTTATRRPWGVPPSAWRGRATLRRAKWVKKTKKKKLVLQR